MSVEVVEYRAGSSRRGRRWVKTGRKGGSTENPLSLVVVGSRGDGRWTSVVTESFVEMGIRSKTWFRVLSVEVTRNERLVGL